MPEQTRPTPAPAGSVAAQIDELIHADVTTDNAGEWYSELAALIPPCTTRSAAGRALRPLPQSVVQRIEAGLAHAQTAAPSSFRMLTPNEVVAGMKFPADYPATMPANHFEDTEHLEWGVRWPSPEGNDDKWFGSEDEARTVNKSNRGESILIRRADTLGAVEPVQDDPHDRCARWYAHDPHDWELHAPGRPLDGTVYRCPGKPEAARQ